MGPQPVSIRVVPPSKHFASYLFDGDNGFSPLAVSISETVSTTATFTPVFGHGHTMDKLMTFLGARLDSVVSRFSETRLGQGPNALVGRMINSVDWSAPECRYDFCPNRRLDREQRRRVGLRKIPPTIMDVVELLSLPFCHICIDSHARALSISSAFTNGCDKLVKQLRRSNPSARLLTAYYVSVLASFHVRIRQIFVDLDAAEAFEDLVYDMKLTSNHNLVAPSRRALVSISESAILPAIKEFNALEYKFDECHHRQLSESEWTSLLPYGVSSLSILVRGLLEPQLQVVAASRLSRSVVWQELSLASILPGLRTSLNGEVMHYLWCLLASTSDPVITGTISRLMVSLYDFGAKSCFNVWDITQDCHIMSAAWAWQTLWMPFFRLRLYSPSKFMQIPTTHLRDICEMFFKWPLVALLMSVQARDSIRVLRALVLEPHTPALPRSPSAADDPVLYLMLEATSPLFEAAGLLHEERLITLEHGGFNIPRYIPLLHLKDLCSQVVSLAMCEDTSDDVAKSPSLLQAIAPYYDVVCRRELQSLVEPYKRSNESYQRGRAEVMLAHLSPQVPERVLNCIGITAGTPQSCSPGVFADHYRGPWAAGRTYDRRQACMLFVAQDSYRDLRWVSAADMNGSGLREYKPVVVPTGVFGRPVYIARLRNVLLDRGELVTMSPEDVESSRSSELHVLCGWMSRCPVFWMTQTKLIHAVTGMECPNELNVDEVFRAFHRLSCPCERTWREYCNGEPE